MKKLIPEFQETKLKIFANNRIIIENFKELKDLNEHLIVVDDYMISGDFLMINKMNSWELEIHGKIKEIIIG